MVRRLNHHPHRAARGARRLGPRVLGATLIVALLGAVGASAFSGRAAPASSRHVATPSITVSLAGASVGPPLPAGFVGLATEYWNVEMEVGTNPKKPDAAFEQVLRNLAPGGGFNLRIGGDSTDWTWWPIAGLKQPPWVRWTMTPAWAAVTDRLVDDLHAHLIVGINMEAGSLKVASAEIHEIRSAMGATPTTFELGNEPELYSHFPFYHGTAGQAVLGRPKAYSLLNMASQWNEMANALPDVRFAGPGYSGLNALPDVGPFLSQSRRLSLVTVHTYPLKSTRCTAGVRPQESELFSTHSLQELAAGIGSWTSLAHQNGVGVRVDEMNSVTCGGQPGFTNTFGPALWALNILPLYAEAGVNGVNFQSRPYTAQNLIQTVHTRAGWRVRVQPEYYGLMEFAQLTPPGSKMLTVGAMPSGLYAWSDRTPLGQTHVVVTNVGTTSVTVAIPAKGATGPASVETLSDGAGGLWATGGIRLGGQMISPSTGQLTGTPVTKSLPATAGAYDVTVAPDSAAILTLRG
ncbi:MAG TPA: hypothetical protein VG228_05730 [Solirubrobacteraceae bacterium]|nr:hypothetical protein [Solirubrobacteraceae bacterium]